MKSVISEIESKALDYLKDQGASTTIVRAMFSSGKGTRTLGIILQTLADYEDMLNNFAVEKVEAEKREFARSEYENQPGETHTRSVLQIDLRTGKVIKIFPSIAKASRETRASANSIGNILRGIGVQSGGYGWRRSTFQYKQCPRCKDIGTVSKRFGYLHCKGKKRPKPYCLDCYKIVVKERNDRRRDIRNDKSQQ